MNYFKIPLLILSFAILQGCANESYALQEYLNKIHLEDMAEQNLEDARAAKTAKKYVKPATKNVAKVASKKPQSMQLAMRVPQPASVSHRATANHYRVIKVRKGDQLNRLVKRYGVSRNEVIALNRLRKPYNLLVGQKLKLPQSNFHTVSKGQYLYQIAEKYHVTLTQLVRENGLKKPYVIKVGQKLRIPSSRSKATSYAKKKPFTTKSYTHKTPQRSTRKIADVGKYSSRAKAPATFSWPVQGKVISKFGNKGGGVSYEGVNIAADEGDRTRAAASGVVVYTGSELKSFGNLVIIRHGGGWLTAYAHQREIFVPKGAIVKKGQVIGRVGASGKVKTPQLHFSIRNGTKAIDPLKVLKG